jgi:hypothetical protein
VLKIRGDKIREALNARALISSTYGFQLPTDWDARKCSIVAFVHRSGVPDFEVLQAATQPIE